ncbi:unnamed protein product [Soboliphyme baturini]|uniref:H/ACA ribonucleoprotein complex subunit n=1 Tax=Soboliphyme baturini TaxID=241478 RepID=A0A183IY30_9BILA|nr:unnamed protein product [Soboliphyme baturini]
MVVLRGMFFDRHGYRAILSDGDYDDSDSDSSSLSSNSATKEDSEDSDSFFCRILEKTNEVRFEEDSEPPKTRGELDIKDLPPIEKLSISVPEDVQMLPAGKVKCTVDCLVIVESYSGACPLDADTSNELTKKVFVDELKTVKGSDASWENNNEPPEHIRYFSDDEEERQWKNRFRRSCDGRRKINTVDVTAVNDDASNATKQQKQRPCGNRNNVPWNTDFHVPPSQHQIYPIADENRRFATGFTQKASVHISPSFTPYPVSSPHGNVNSAASGTASNLNIQNRLDNARMFFTPASFRPPQPNNQ